MRILRFIVLLMVVCLLNANVQAAVLSCTEAGESGNAAHVELLSEAEHSSECDKCVDCGHAKYHQVCAFLAQRPYEPVKGYSSVVFGLLSHRGSGVVADVPQSPPKA